MRGLRRDRAVEKGGNKSIIIDSLEFAQSQNSVAGQIEVASLERLSDVLLDERGALSFTVTGEWLEGKGFLRVELAGELLLKCQRCLAELPYPIHLSRRLALIETPDEWDDEALEDDGYDEIPAERELDVKLLLEDEILLELPVSPHHSACKPPQFDDGNANILPFAALAKLKR